MEEEEVLVAVAVATLAPAAASGALLAAAPVLRQLPTAVAFDQRRLSVAAVHTIPAEVSLDQVPRLDSIMVVIA